MTASGMIGIVETDPRWMLDDPARGWTAEELATHVREEHSTYSWLLEPMLERVGFEIAEREVSPSRTFAAYVCLRHQGRP